MTNRDLREQVLGSEGRLGVITEAIVASGNMTG
jgi:FAD/FMN-containing dehydrogenase